MRRTWKYKCKLMEKILRNIAQNIDFVFLEIEMENNAIKLNGVNWLQNTTTILLGWRYRVGCTFLNIPYLQYSDNTGENVHNLLLLYCYKLDWLFRDYLFTMVKSLVNLKCGTAKSQLKGTTHLSDDDKHGSQNYGGSHDRKHNNFSCREGHIAGHLRSWVSLLNLTISNNDIFKHFARECPN